MSPLPPAELAEALGEVARLIRGYVAAPLTTQPLLKALAMIETLEAGEDPRQEKLEL